MIEIATPWFEARRLSSRVTQIDEPHVHLLFRANMFLIEGDASDLILDTGMGIAPLRPFVDALRRDPDKPIICVSSHCHVDHIGGAHEFETRLVHPAEAAEQAAPRPVSLDADTYPDALRRMFVEAGYPDLEGLMIDALPHAGYDPGAYALTPAPATRLIEAGDTIDLGGIVFEVVHLPGHSPGGIGLFDRAERALFAGDAIYDGPLIWQGAGMSVSDYRATFDTLEALPVETIHGGHDPCFGRARMLEIIAEYRRIWDAL